jgi:7-cyano-7-deazaguanine reductase
MVSDELKEKIRGMKFLYKKVPQPELLLAIPNESIKFSHKVTHTTDEFTSICPLHEYQPDYANITISFFPGELNVELKSLKYYLQAFRDVPIFHERVPNQILEDLVELLNPVSMVVIGEFSTRGGLRTRVEAFYERKNE